jgi:hypothetical protein
MWKINVTDIFTLREYVRFAVRGIYNEISILSCRRWGKYAE